MSKRSRAIAFPLRVPRAVQLQAALLGEQEALDALGPEVAAAQVLRAGLAPFSRL